MPRKPNRNKSRQNIQPKNINKARKMSSRRGNSKNKKNSKAEIYNYLKRKGFTWEDISCELNNF